MGKVTRQIFEDNTKAWSGDHCIDPRLVPGVLFSSHKFIEDKPAIVDVAPTILKTVWPRLACAFRRQTVGVASPAGDR